ncbi:SDR family oxidoreductase [Microlunatus flavus]|uniref:3-oxoacyl-[acyl-carrier protein] reductase n=1 Tax=Microlunatus flavus TaxID=1036181 RepID=A0A1H8ZMS3_9ACTN|nr:SDR family oxidoreductase [Microlunatus flavus]SEP65607.1 3-oxoacyl-[acyl-carrier protein] reductase [Microlunatus flavus]
MPILTAPTTTTSTAPTGSTARTRVLAGRRVLVPGGTGAVGEGVVRAYLDAGADVVVPSRSAVRAAELHALLGPEDAARLHVFEHDYTTFAGAGSLVATMLDRLGGVDDVVAPIGGWWAGRRLTEVEDTDWQSAFVGLATTHLAVARAALPHLPRQGAYAVVVGQSAHHPVPGSGLVSMEQAAVLMMQRVLAAEAGDEARVFALVLGPVRTRAVAGEPAWVSAAQVGSVAVALSADPSLTSAELGLGDGDAARAVLEELADRTGR